MLFYYTIYQTIFDFIYRNVILFEWLNVLSNCSIYKIENKKVVWELQKSKNAIGDSTIPFNEIFDNLNAS